MKAKQTWRRALTNTHAIVLAGGGGARMGGVSKADLQLGGKRLLDWVLADIFASGLVSGQVVVVGPPSIDVPTGVRQTLEDPPAGGPVAGIFAGLQAGAVNASDTVWLATCDAPRAAAVLGDLHAKLAASEANIEAVIAKDATGRGQYLLGCYRAAALYARAKTWRASGRRLHGAPMWRFISTLKVTEVECDHQLLADVDTWQDLEDLTQMAPAAREAQSSQRPSGSED